MSIVQEIQEADTLIRPYVRETPTESSVLLSDSDTQVFLKLENFQVTGSFKARGALHKLRRLNPAQREAGVVSASSGNHGAAVAYGARRLGIKARVFVPEHADPGKIKVIESHGAEVTLFGQDCVIAEARAREVAADVGAVYVSPYNDREVMVGQGTLGAELHRQLPEGIDAVFIALGGGGLIAGVGHYIRHAFPKAQMIACSPEQSPAMHVCLEEGAIRDVPCYDTLSDATAGGVEAGSITFAHCQKTIDRSILLSEEEIKRSTRSFIATHRMLIEGAAGVALAGFERLRAEMAGKRVVIVLCGANIGFAKLQRLLA